LSAARSPLRHVFAGAGRSSNRGHQPPPVFAESEPTVAMTPPDSIVDRSISEAPLHRAVPHDNRGQNTGDPVSAASPCCKTIHRRGRRGKPSLPVVSVGAPPLVLAVSARMGAAGGRERTGMRPVLAAVVLGPLFSSSANRTDGSPGPALSGAAPCGNNRLASIAGAPRRQFLPNGARIKKPRKKAPTPTARDGRSAGRGGRPKEANVRGPAGRRARPPQRRLVRRAG